MTLRVKEVYTYSDRYNVGSEVDMWVLIILSVIYGPFLLIFLFGQFAFHGEERIAYKAGKLNEYMAAKAKKPILLLNPAKRPTVDTEEYFDRYMPKA